MSSVEESSTFPSTREEDEDHSLTSDATRQAESVFQTGNQAPFPSESAGLLTTDLPPRDHIEGKTNTTEENPNVNNSNPDTFPFEDTNVYSRFGSFSHIGPPEDSEEEPNRIKNIDSESLPAPSYPHESQGTDDSNKLNFSGQDYSSSDQTSIENTLSVLDLFNTGNTSVEVVKERINSSNNSAIKDDPLRENEESNLKTERKDHFLKQTKNSDRTELSSKYVPLASDRKSLESIHLQRTSPNGLSHELTDTNQFVLKKDETIPNNVDTNENNLSSGLDQFQDSLKAITSTDEMDSDAYLNRYGSVDKYSGRNPDGQAVQSGSRKKEKIYVSTGDVLDDSEEYRFIDSRLTDYPDQSPKVHDSLETSLGELTVEKNSNRFEDRNVERPEREVSEKEYVLKGPVGRGVYSEPEQLKKEKVYQDVLQVRIHQGKSRDKSITVPKVVPRRSNVLRDSLEESDISAEESPKMGDMFTGNSLGLHQSTPRVSQQYQDVPEFNQANYSFHHPQASMEHPKVQSGSDKRNASTEIDMPSVLMNSEGIAHLYQDQIQQNQPLHMMQENVQYPQGSYESNHQPHNSPMVPYRSSDSSTSSLRHDQSFRNRPQLVIELPARPPVDFVSKNKAVLSNPEASKGYVQLHIEKREDEDILKRIPVPATGRPVHERDITSEATWRQCSDKLKDTPKKNMPRSRTTSPKRNKFSAANSSTGVPPFSQESRKGKDVIPVNQAFPPFYNQKHPYTDAQNYVSAKYSPQHNYAPNVAASLPITQTVHTEDGQRISVDVNLRLISPPPAVSSSRGAPRHGPLAPLGSPVMLMRPQYGDEPYSAWQHEGLQTGKMVYTRHGQFQPHLPSTGSPALPNNGDHPIYPEYSGRSKIDAPDESSSWVNNSHRIQEKSLSESAYQVTPRGRYSETLGMADIDRVSVRTQPLPIVPIRSISGGEVEESYAAMHKKLKDKRVDYKPYTLKDYRRLHLESNMGKLGPDLDNDSFRDRFDKRQRQIDFARQAHERNTELLTKQREAVQRYQNQSSDDLMSRRQVAMEYAKSLRQAHDRHRKTKSGSRPTVHNVHGYEQSASVPNVRLASLDTESREIAQSNMLQKLELEMQELELLKERHEREKQTVLNMQKESRITQNVG